MAARSALGCNLHMIKMSTCIAASPFVRPAPSVQLTCSQRSRRPVRVCATFKARWSLDVKFGSKMDAVSLLQEWVRGIGSAAGLTPQNTQLRTGSIGAPESTLELEVAFDSLADLEAFWASIPQEAHCAWGQRMQNYIVHGSPQWQVYRTLPAFPEGAAGAAGLSIRTVPRSLPSSSSSGGTSPPGSLVMPSSEELNRFAAETAEPAVPSTRQQTASGLSIVSGEDEVQEALDWKGDPMKINPGDKLPFKFL